jgi:hypothetical protein
VVCPACTYYTDTISLVHINMPFEMRVPPIWLTTFTGAYYIFSGSTQINVNAITQWDQQSYTHGSLYIGHPSQSFHAVMLKCTNGGYFEWSADL